MCDISGHQVLNDFFNIPGLSPRVPGFDLEYWQSFLESFEESDSGPWPLVSESDSDDEV